MRDVRHDVEVVAEEAEVVDAVVADAAVRGGARLLEERGEPGKQKFLEWLNTDWLPMDGHFNVNTVMHLYSNRSAIHW